MTLGQAPPEAMNWGAAEWIAILALIVAIGVPIGIYYREKLNSRSDARSKDELDALRDILSALDYTNEIVRKIELYRFATKSELNEIDISGAADRLQRCAPDPKLNTRDKKDLQPVLSGLATFVGGLKHAYPPEPSEVLYALSGQDRDLQAQRLHKIIMEFIENAQKQWSEVDHVKKFEKLIRDRVESLVNERRRS